MTHRTPDLAEDNTFVIALGLVWPGIGQLMQGRGGPAIAFGASAALLVGCGFIMPEMRMVFWTAAIGVAVWSSADVMARVRYKSRTT